MKCGASKFHWALSKRGGDDDDDEPLTMRRYIACLASQITDAYNGETLLT